MISQANSSANEEFKREEDIPRPMIQALNTSRQIDTIKTVELQRFMKSKQDIYNILLTEGKHDPLSDGLGQYYLPPYSECSVEFLRELFAGRKMVSYGLNNNRLCLTAR